MPKFNYTDFSGSTGLNLVSVAAAVGSALRVGTTLSSGAVWYPDKVIVRRPWQVDFTFNFNGVVAGFGDGDGDGGDGMVFVIQDEANNLVKVGGGGIGYGDPNFGGGTLGFIRCMAVEFDTYNNGSGTLDNNDGNHIAIHSGGSGHVNSTNEGGHRKGQYAVATRMNNSANHSARVVYDGTTVSVFYETFVTPVLTWAPSGGLDSFLGLSGGSAYVGFTAAPGSAKENHDLISWSGEFADGASLSQVSFRVG
jgi:hypothetical protein